MPIPPISARVMALSIHPYIMGAPHRVKYFRRVFEEIRKKATCCSGPARRSLDWYLGAGPKARETAVRNPEASLSRRAAPTPARS